MPKVAIRWGDGSAFFADPHRRVDMEVVPRQGESIQFENENSDLISARVLHVIHHLDVVATVEIVLERLQEGKHFVFMDWQDSASAPSWLATDDDGVWLHCDVVPRTGDVMEFIQSYGMNEDHQPVYGEIVVVEVVRVIHNFFCEQKTDEAGSFFNFGPPVVGVTVALAQGFDARTARRIIVPN